MKIKILIGAVLLRTVLIGCGLWALEDATGIEPSFINVFGTYLVLLTVDVEEK